MDGNIINARKHDDAVVAASNTKLGSAEAHAPFQ